MAQTEYTPASAQAKRLYEEKLYRDVVKGIYFKAFMGKGIDDVTSMVNTKNDLEKEKGGKIDFAIRMRLTGDGVTGDDTLEGNEEDLTTYTKTLTIERYRHGIRDKGAVTRQVTYFSVDGESRQAIIDWGAEKTDKLCMEALTANPTKIFYGGDASGTGDIDSGDKLTLTLVNKMKTWARTGGARSYVPFRPIMINGKPYYVFLGHPDALFDLKEDSTYQQAMREAEVRGSENPLFTGAQAIWQGVVFHEHENVPIVSTWGGGGAEPGAKCAFMGAQALCLAWGRRGTIVEETFDYGNQHGFAYDMIMKVEKPVFNSLDFGSVGVYVYRTDVSGS